MTVENTTPNRGYQLPNSANDLADDVLRIISAIMAADVDVAAILTALLTKANTEHSHVISDITGLTGALLAKQELGDKGTANGYASLGVDGKVPAAQLPAALFGALSYQGTWNASTNSPLIPAASGGNKGNYYKVSVAGTTSIGGVTDWEVGDWIVSNGAVWDKIDNTDQVLSVAGLRGEITANALAIALDLQAALQRSGGTMTGAIIFALAQTAALKLQDWQQGYGLYSDNTGTKGTTRLWFDAPDLGEIILGPRAGANALAWLRVRAALASLEGDVEIGGKLTLAVAPGSPNEAASKYYVDKMAIGVGQTWQDVEASRVNGTSYQNTTGRPIMVVVSQAGKSPSLQVSANNSTWLTIGQQASGGDENGSIGGIIPPNWYYRTLGGFYKWMELR